MSTPATVPFVDLRRLHSECRDELLGAFARVVDSGGYVQGAEVAALEAESARACETPHALAVSNGTSALHLALMACGVGPGDEVITVANTFIATAEAISMTGARPVFVDIERDGFNMDPAAIEAAITPRTRAIVPVHLYGEVANMPAIMAIARQHVLKVVEDACQAHGAMLGGRRAGTFGDAGCLSFYPTKNIGTVGEGGMVLTANATLAARIASLRDHGQRGRHHHVEPGFNNRMPELQAAALRVFLPHLEAWNARRIGAATQYASGLAGPGLVLPRTPSNGEHVYHLYVVRARERESLRQHLAESGIETAIHYPTPIHLQPAYAACGGGHGSLPRTEEAVREILSLPMHPLITRDEIAAVTKAVLSFDPAGHRVEAGTGASR